MKIFLMSLIFFLGSISFACVEEGGKDDKIIGYSCRYKEKPLNIKMGEGRSTVVYDGQKQDCTTVPGTSRVTTLICPRSLFSIDQQYGVIRYTVYNQQKNETGFSEVFRCYGDRRQLNPTPFDRSGVR